MAVDGKTERNPGNTQTVGIQINTQVKVVPFGSVTIQVSIRGQPSPVPPEQPEETVQYCQSPITALQSYQVPDAEMPWYYSVPTTTAYSPTCAQ